jgi:hypothetical protein
MCHNLRDRKLVTEEARKPRAVSKTVLRAVGKRGHSESAREGLAATTEVQGKTTN